MSEKVLELLREAADAAVALDPDGVPVADLAEVIEAADRQVQRVRGAIASWTGALDRRGGLKDAGFRDASHFLKDRLRQSHGEAKKTAKIAGRLEQLDDTKQALDDGDITLEQAATIAETAEQLARDTALDQDSTEVVSEAEKTLLHSARTADAGRLRKEGRRLVDRHSTRTAQRDAQMAHRQRRINLTDVGGGVTLVEGQLTSTVGAKLRAALDAHNLPTGPDDVRSTQQRNADALEALLDDAGSGGTPDRLGGVVAVAPLDALAPGSESGGLLRGRTPITTEALQGLVCQYGLQLLVTDPNGQPLWLGDTVRLATPAQRVALTVRDAGCRWPGCSMPADRCLAHHVDYDPESDDPGPTDVDRLVLLCQTHHNRVHHGHWQLDLSADATVTVHAPYGSTSRTETSTEARRRHTGTDLIQDARPRPTAASEERGTYRTRPRTEHRPVPCAIGGRVTIRRRPPPRPG